MAEKKGKAIWDVKIVRGAIWDSMLKLNPRKMMGNPVMFVVEVGSVMTTVLLVRDVLRTRDSSASICRSRCGCGLPCCSPISPKPWRKGAARPRPRRCARPGRKRSPIGCCPTAGLKRSPVPNCVPATWCRWPPANSFQVTAKSSKASRRWTSPRSPANRRPVIREAGGDRSAVTGGTRVLSDQIKVRITSNPARPFSIA